MIRKTRAPALPILAAGLLSILHCFSPPALFADTIPLSEIVNVRHADNENARPVLNKSTANKPLAIAGREYASGLGAQANTTIFIAPNAATRFTALVGVDDATDAGVTIRAAVVADGRTLWSNDNLRRGQPPARVDVALSNAKELRLVIEDTGHALTHAHVDWVDASFEYAASGAPPASIAAIPLVEKPYILTPKPGPAPRINGPRVFGVRPGHPFLHTIPATGERPIAFAADNLPPGLALDAATGRITGKIDKPGTHRVTLRARNALGETTRDFRIEVGERISLTPALGWNSWNCWAKDVDQDKILRAARAMRDSGLINHGWTYINIDDAWQAPARGGPHNAIQPNEKFPDIRALADTIHSLGLKIGIYSTPWKTSYATYIGGSADTADGAWSKPERGAGGQRGISGPWSLGKHSFAVNDARQWADWGIDYLKYDWNPNELPETAEMAKALRESGRDIILSLSNSMPMRNVAALSKHAHSWRTTGDIHDTWGRMQSLGFSQDKWRPYAGPGHWNDPDMLIVGYVGWSANLHPTKLTPDEQYTHITLWSLLCSPLLIGCDLERLDAFTLNLLTNDEVLEVNQDPLGAQAAQTWADGRRQAWTKPMEDGSRAIGLFNLSPRPDTYTVTWKQLGIDVPPARLRDLWRQQDMKVGRDGITVTLPRHGTLLLRAWPAG